MGAIPGMAFWLSFPKRVIFQIIAILRRCSFHPYRSLKPSLGFLMLKPKGNFWKVCRKSKVMTNLCGKILKKRQISKMRYISNCLTSDIPSSVDNQLFQLQKQKYDNCKVTYFFKFVALFFYSLTLNLF